jgi:hypothetical protein
MIARLAKGLTEHPAEISDTNYADDVRVQSLDFVRGLFRSRILIRFNQWAFYK